MQPLQTVNEGQNEGVARRNELQPRVDIGVLPTVYDLPVFPDHIQARIERFGRTIDRATKDEILEIIMKDMMRYSCYL